MYRYHVCLARGKGRQCEPKGKRAQQHPAQQNYAPVPYHLGQSQLKLGLMYYQGKAVY